MFVGFVEVDDHSADEVLAFLKFIESPFCTVTHCELLAQFSGDSRVPPDQVAVWLKNWSRHR
jgi:hypothetical protein